MNKKERQDRILNAIGRRRVTSQEGLRRILLREGIDVTQATLSRDIRELRLVKAPGPDGVARYSLGQEWESKPPLRSLLPPLFRSAEGVGHLLVVRTRTGAAQTVAAGIDWEGWPEVLGTLAGDDTVLLVLRTAESVPEIQRRLEELAGGTS